MRVIVLAVLVGALLASRSNLPAQSGWQSFVGEHDQMRRIEADRI